MRLTHLSDYSVRVLIYLSVNPEPLSTIAEISERYGISRNHLTKVAHQLGRAGYLTTLRGRAGGIKLAREPQAINIGEVVRLMESPSALVECFQGEKNECRITPDCTFKHVLADAQEAFFAHLDQFTLASITDNRSALQALLSLPLAETSHAE